MKPLPTKLSQAFVLYLGAALSVLKVVNKRSPNILLISGTSSVEHLRENLKAADLQLPPQTITDLNAIATAKVR